MTEVCTPMVSRDGSELAERCRTVADWLHAHKLAEPARILIELHQPLQGLGSAVATVLTPIAGLCGVGSLWTRLHWFLEYPERISALLDALEESPA